MPRPVRKRRFTGPAISFAVSILIFFLSNSLAWLPFVMLSVFLVSIEVFHADRSISSDANSIPSSPIPEIGALGDYTVGGAKSYGLFLVLNDHPVFVDIRKDRFIDDREKFALMLFENKKVLEDRLRKFVMAFPEYRTRRLAYVGLHSKKLNEGELFWEPDGYSKLRELEFHSA